MPFPRGSKTTLARLADPETQTDAVASLTEAALAARDPDEARFWADRWRRLQPGDGNAWLANARVAWLAGGDATDAVRKAREAATPPSLAQRVAAAGAAHDAGAIDDAVQLLAEALQDPGFTAEATHRALATEIARAANAPGWIARTRHGAMLHLFTGDDPSLRYQENSVAAAKQRDGSWRADITVARLDTVLHATDGMQKLLGSPLPLELTTRERRALLASRPIPHGSAKRGKEDPSRPLTILVPVYGGGDVTRACITAVLATKRADDELLVIDDAGPDADLLDWLRDHAAQGRLRLLANARNLGFPATVNRGIAESSGRDLLLLNSDALPHGDWLARLRNAAYAKPDIGTVTALSNDASICSYPSFRRKNEIPDVVRAAELDSAAARMNSGVSVDLPTGVGFCLWIRRDCLDQVGPFDEVAYGSGYGEENDFCLRATAHGWRHVAAADVYVGHVGGHSFGASKQARIKRNLRTLNELHPGYEKLVQRWAKQDPLRDARAAIDAALLLGRSTRPSVILVTIDLEGGVAHHVQMRVQELAAQGLRALVLRPLPRLKAGALAIDEGAERLYPNLAFDLPRKIGELTRLLAATQPRWIEIHQPMQHDASVLTLPAQLGVPYDVRLHDYAWICPRVTLLDEFDRYCGEPDIGDCEHCLARNGTRVPGVTSVASLRASSAAFLASARSVIAPSDDVVRRMARYAPLARIKQTPWEAPAVAAAMPARGTSGRLRAVLLGAIGQHKGYNVLLGCARDAQRRDLPLEFVVVGFTHDDGLLLHTGRARITGEFKPNEADTLLAAQQADLALFLSPGPETWSYALSQALRAGLPVVAFDTGAIGERLRAASHPSLLLPSSTDPAAINDALLALAAQAAQNDPAQHTAPEGAQKDLA
jgi:GT2 family glycosyltransferase/glycosyltransferase involved in cell wall biosynthesis